MGLDQLLALEAMILPRPLPTDLVKQRSGFMIALMVPKASETAVARSGGWSGGAPTWEDQLHFTISYVPKGPGRFESAVQATRKAASGFPAFEMMTTRAGFFLPNDKNDGKLVHYVGGAAPGLEAFVASLRRELDRAGLLHDLDFPIFVPHCTIEYVDSPSEYEVLKRLQLSLSETPARFVPDLAVIDGKKVVSVPWSTESTGASWQASRSSVLSAGAE